MDIKLSKVKRLMSFWTNYKIPKMLRKLSDDELISLYEEYSPVVYNNGLLCITPINDLICYGVVLIPKIGDELKRRHQENNKLINWDYTDKMNLRSVVQDYK